MPRVDVEEKGDFTSLIVSERMYQHLCQKGVKFLIIEETYDFRRKQKIFAVLPLGRSFELQKYDGHTLYCSNFFSDNVKSLVDALLEYQKTSINVFRDLCKMFMINEQEGYSLCPEIQKQVKTSVKYLLKHRKETARTLRLMEQEIKRRKQTNEKTQ